MSRRRLPPLVSVGFASVGLAAVGLAPGVSSAASTLSLAQYIEQVSSQNQGVQASARAAEGARARSAEADLVLSPVFFANFQLLTDKSASTSAIQRDRLIANGYTAGVSKAFDFGLTAKLSYAVNYTQLDGAVLTGATTPTSFSYHDAKPALELSQSLWRNAWGTETRAAMEASRSAALATHHVESFRVKAALAEAEGTYWRLALARETVAVQRESLERGVKLRDWASRRSQAGLGDRSDFLQSQAALEVRRLELQAALDEQLAASRAFNSARGIDSEEVAESLVELDPRLIGELARSAPPRSAMREDTLSALEASRAQAAAADLGAERNTPDFQLYASLALNGNDPALGPAVGESLGTSRPTGLLGVRLSIPLDVFTARDVRSGYRSERIGAELLAERRYFEQERDWKDLSSRLAESKTRFELAGRIEKIQKEKLDLERERLNRGRTTTYQLLLFEQDFAAAQLSRIRAQADVLRLLATLKTYSSISSLPAPSLSAPPLSSAPGGAS